MRTAWAIDGPEDAPPIMLLPSVGTDREMWAPQVSALGHDYRLIRFEARGHGKASASDPPYTLADLGRDVIDAADTLGLASFHLVGISLGGLTALWLAIHHGDRLRSLTVANTAGRIGTRRGWDERIAMVRQKGMPGIADQVMTRFFSERFRVSHPATVRVIRTSFEHVDQEGYIGCCTALGDADVRPQLKDINTSTLVVAGRFDASTPPEQGQHLHRAIPDSTYIELNAGHLSNLERPAEFVAALRRHLERHRYT